MADNRADTKRESAHPIWVLADRHALIAAIVIVGLALRVYHAGQSSLWYDEVVTMKLARTPSPLALLELLPQLDATHAPLHPILLQSWLKLFGSSDYSGRAFSILCGSLTIAFMYWIGLQAVNERTALWASWLCALSPLLVYYSREARMYMWLVLVTCLAWGLLLSRIHSPKRWSLILYGCALVAIVYSHPLGLLMVCALGLTAAIFRHAFRISWRGWFYIHLASGLATFPWLAQYLNHAPESTSGLLPVRYLLGMPIGFVGGNFCVLLLCFLLIAYGQCQIEWQLWRRPRVIFTPEVSSVCLLIWLILPPVFLYFYSYVVYPIFGPSRYTLFVAPAYLLLVAQGLAKLPRFLSLFAGMAGVCISGTMLFHDVYRSDRYTDWRSVAGYLDQHDPSTPVFILTGGAFRNTELEVARYYFGSNRLVLPWGNSPNRPVGHQGNVWILVGLQANQSVKDLPDKLETRKVVQEIVEFAGVRMVKVNFQQSSALGK